MTVVNGRRRARTRLVIDVNPAGDGPGYSERLPLYPNVETSPLMTASNTKPEPDVQPAVPPELPPAENAPELPPDRPVELPPEAVPPPPEVVPELPPQPPPPELAAPRGPSAVLPGRTDAVGV